MKKNLIVFVCFVVNFFASVTASAQKSSPYYTDNEQSAIIIRDGSGQAEYHREVILANAVENLSKRLGELTLRIQRGESVNKGIIDLSRVPESIPGLSKEQKIEVRRIVDRAIIKASVGDVGGLKTIKEEILSLWGKVKDHEERIKKLEASAATPVVASGDKSVVHGNVPTIVQLAYDATVAKKKAEEARLAAEALKAEVEKLKSQKSQPQPMSGNLSVTDEDWAQTLKQVGETKAQADTAAVKAQEALDLAKGGSVDSDALKEVNGRVEAVEKTVSKNTTDLATMTGRVSSVEQNVQRALYKAQEALYAANKSKADSGKIKSAEKKAEEALRVAKDKADPGIVDIAVEGFFSGRINAAMLGTGTYWFKKYRFRIGLGGGVGYGQAEGADHGWSIQTKLQFGYEILKYGWGAGWAGLYVSTYGVGDDLSRQEVFGYSGGGFLRYVSPEIGKSGINLALTGYGGTANEFFWVAADPPADIVPGAPYDTERKDDHWTWNAGIGVSMLF